MWEYGFLLSRIFPYDSFLIRENTGLQKAVFYHILRSIYSTSVQQQQEYRYCYFVRISLMFWLAIFFWVSRSSHPEVKKCSHKFRKIHRKTLVLHCILMSIFIIKKRLWHRSFPVNFQKYLYLEHLWTVASGCSWFFVVQLGCFTGSDLMRLVSFYIPWKYKKTSCAF